MTEGTLSDQGTLQLSHQFLKVSREYEAIRYASFVEHPFWWVAEKLWLLNKLRDGKINKLRRRRQELIGELAVRYHGMLRQLFDCANPGSSFSEYLVKVWRTFQDKASTTHDPRLFSICLWELQRNCGVNPSDLSAIKPRFMLKQFVDEMPREESRGALLTLVYGRSVKVDDVNLEVVRLVKNAYHLLHAQVEWRSQLDDLELLTGGVLSNTVVSHFAPPFVRYHEWLFQTC